MSDMYSCLNRRLPRRYSPNCLRSLIIGWRLPLWRHGTLTDLENQLVSIRYYQNIYQYKELHSVLYYDLFDRTWKYWIEKGWGIYAMGSIADKPPSIWHEYNFLKFQRKWIRVTWPKISKSYGLRYANDIRLSMTPLSTWNAQNHILFMQYWDQVCSCLSF